MASSNNLNIIEAILQGNDDVALRHLYKICLPKIKKMVTKFGGTIDDSKDVFQDGVVILYRKIKKREMPEHSNVESFLYTMCKNIWLNKMKKDSKMTHPEILPETIDTHADIHNHLELTEKTSEIAKIFDRLGDKCSQLLNLLFLKHLSTEEIAIEMNLASTDVVKTTKNRCKNKLIELLEEYPHLRKALSGQA
jgi:RNA polymerase sigma factor (sigma-70 family)